MKKLLLVCLIILAMGLLALCFWQQNIDTAKYEFFPEEHCEKCLVPDLPVLPSGENISRLSGSSEFYFYSTEEGFAEYLEDLYSYLSSCGFKYLGYRGDKIGALTNFEFFESDELFDHRVFEDVTDEAGKKGYIFIWSNGISEENGALSDYSYIELSRTAKSQEYGENTGFGYNTVMKLKNGGSGTYKLTEEAAGGFVRGEDDFIPYALAYTAPKSVDAAQKKASLGLFYGLIAGNDADGDYENAEIAVSFDGGEAELIKSISLAKLTSEQYTVGEFSEEGKNHLVYEHEEKYTFATELLTKEEGVITFSFAEYARRGEEGEMEGFRVEIEVPYKKAEGKIVFGE